MSTATFIIGESGTGKSTSLRNLNPEETLLIQAIKKPLPFRSNQWKYVAKDTPGSIYVSDNSAHIIKAVQRTSKKIIVIDDFQYILANEFMRRTDEKGFDKFTDIGKHAWDILRVASALPDDVRVYILSHSETSDSGRVKAKTIGKMLDEKITIEGMFTIVMRTAIVNDSYLFSTRNNGSDTVKTPMGMFEEEFIENDLNMIDQRICEYYELAHAA